MPRAGIVHVVPGSAAGLTATRSSMWHQDVPGVPGQNEADDGFGGAVAG